MRKTKRVEDRAYSLLGIMGVSMDVRYGDGEREFVRLQKEILKQPRGIHVLVWRRFGDSPRTQLLAKGPENFYVCSRIVSDPSVADGAEMWQTNVGLKGTFSVFDCSLGHRDDSGLYLIPLDCYDQRAPDTLLALRARRVFSRTGTFTLAVEQDQDPYSAMASRFDGIASITFEQYAKRIPMKLTILWEWQKPSLQSRGRGIQSWRHTVETSRAASVPRRSLNSESRTQYTPPMRRSRSNGQRDDLRSSATHSQGREGRSLGFGQQHMPILAVDHATTSFKSNWVEEFATFLKDENRHHEAGQSRASPQMERNATSDGSLRINTPDIQDHRSLAPNTLDGSSRRRQHRGGSDGQSLGEPRYGEPLDEVIKGTGAHFDLDNRPKYPLRTFLDQFGAARYSGTHESMRSASRSLEISLKNRYGLPHERVSTPAPESTVGQPERGAGGGKQRDIQNDPKHGMLLSK